MERVNEFRSYKSSDNEIDSLKIQLKAGFFLSFFVKREAKIYYRKNFRVVNDLVKNQCLAYPLFKQLNKGK